MSKQNIVLSDIETKENNKEISFKRKIYIECFCDDIDHIGRIILDRELNKKDNFSSFSMYLETNANSYLKRFHIYNTDGLYKLTIPLQFIKFKLSDIYRRIKLSLQVLFKDTIYIPLDWCIEDDTILKLADSIKDSYNYMNNLNIKGENNGQ